MRKSLGFWLIALISAGALAFWSVYAVSGPLWSSWAIVFRTIGRITGILGLVLFSLNLVLSARFKFLEPYFGGLAGEYISHHKMGTVAFVLLLIHPGFLTLQFLTFSLSAAADFLTPSFANLPLLSGTLGLGLMIVALVITFYFRLAYQRWKFTHKMLGFAFFLGSLHSFFIPSDISAYAPLYWYMLVIVLAGLIAFIYHSLLGRLWARRQRYTVKNVLARGAGVWEIILAPTGAGHSFAPGQFAFLSFQNSALSTEDHPFSVLTGVGEREIVFGIKESGDYTGRLKELTAGVTAVVEGPYGRFALGGDHQKRDLVWVAGGIGITPFLSMARSLPSYTNRQIDLYYSVKTASEAVFRPELEKLAAEHSNFQVHFVSTDTDGYITGELLQKQLGGIMEREVYICGPVPMMRSLRAQLVGLGLPNDRIHSEEFALF